MAAHDSSVPTAILRDATLRVAPQDEAGGGRVRPRRYTNFTFFSGRLRTGLPVAAKTALRTAGATTLIVGSPTPPQKSPDGTITVSTLGISARRRICYRSKLRSVMRPFSTAHPP